MELRRSGQGEPRREFSGGAGDAGMGSPATTSGDDGIDQLEVRSIYALGCARSLPRTTTSSAFPPPLRPAPSSPFSSLSLPSRPPAFPHCYTNFCPYDTRFHYSSFPRQVKTR